MDIGKEIRKARLKGGFTQKSLALELNTSSQYINMIENNKRTPSIKTLVRLSELTGCNLVLSIE